MAVTQRLHRAVVSSASTHEMEPGESFATYTKVLPLTRQKVDFTHVGVGALFRNISSQSPSRHLANINAACSSPIVSVSCYTQTNINIRYTRHDY